MCRDCGCEEGNARAYFAAHGHGNEHEHDHAHDHVHLPHDGGALPLQIHVHVHLEYAHAHPHAHDREHDHEHDHEHEHPSASLGAGEEAPPVELDLDDDPRHGQPAGPRTVSVERRVLARNDAIAARNRAWLAERGVVALNLISSPGSGKTELLVKTLTALRGRVQASVLVGDQQTDLDASRLEGHGAPVRQIETHAACHLNAEHVGGLLEEMVPAGTKLLIVENVGNLVCPAAFDLGEAHKVALLSVTEGEDKPLKYPVLFADSPVAVIAKTDLLPHLDLDLDALRANLKKIRPDVQIFELSAKTGEGLGAWVAYLEGLIEE